MPLWQRWPLPQSSGGIARQPQLVLATSLPPLRCSVKGALCRTLCYPRHQSHLHSDWLSTTLLKKRRAYTFRLAAITAQSETRYLRFGYDLSRADVAARCTPISWNWRAHQPSRAACIQDRRTLKDCWSLWIDASCWTQNRKEGPAHAS